MQGDFFSLPNQPQFDALVAAMVLHHMPSPEAFFEKRQQRSQSQAAIW